MLHYDERMKDYICIYTSLNDLYPIIGRMFAWSGRFITLGPLTFFSRIPFTMGFTMGWIILEV